MISVTPVILVGGIGSRLWPVSREAHPKQFEALTGSASMLQETVRRVSRCADAGVRFDAPVVISNRRHRMRVEADLAALSVSPGALVLEPVGRSTGPCAVVAAELAAETDPSALLLLMPSDHHLGDPDAFRAAVARAAPAARDGALVVFGVPPTRAETGFGYILAEGEAKVRPVVRFIEKPDARTAADFVADGRYFWNAGIFLMRADRVLEEMRAFEPGLLAAAGAALAGARRSGVVVELADEAMAACPSQSLDKAVMERTSHAAMTPLDAGWSDIGSFEALWEIAGKDPDGNGVRGPALLVDTEGCLIRTDGPLVAAVGVSDLVVVVHDGVVLIAPRAEAQRVKELVEQARAEGRQDLL